LNRILEEQDLNILMEIANESDGLKPASCKLIIDSHRSLLEANATLSFENIRLRNIEKALQELHPGLNTQAEIITWLESTTGFKREAS
jgi:hypothetical protein